MPSPASLHQTKSSQHNSTMQVSARPAVRATTARRAVKVQASAVQRVAQVSICGSPMHGGQRPEALRDSAVRRSSC